MTKAGYHKPSYAAVLAAVLAAGPGMLVLFADAVRAAERTVECSVLYETPDGLHLDAGAEAGLAAGDAGAVYRGGEEIARVEVVQTSTSWTLVRIVLLSGTARPAVGDRAVLTAGRPPGAGGAPGRPEAALKASPDEEEPFVPLLAPPGSPGLARAKAANVFHGELSLRQLFQLDPDGDQDYSVTRVGTSGTFERMGGGPWTAEWSGDVSYRDGKGLEATPDYREYRVHVVRASLFRRFADGGSLRLGRFLPRELPGVGYLDGVQGDKRISEHLRIGAMLGVKPDRATFDLSTREPTAVPYLSFEAGERGRFYYSGTAGALGSLYEGEPDRLAMLIDQRLDLLRGLSLYCTSAVDFDVAMETRSGTRLTRLDAFASYAIAPPLTLRGGADHYERPDTQAARDALDIDDVRFFDSGYWRYWVGASHSLPWSLLLSEEVGLIDSSAGDGDVHWLASLTRTGLPWMPEASMTLSAYNLSGTGTDGHGGSLSANLPFLDRLVLLDMGLTFRYLETDVDAGDFRLTDASGRVSWIISSSWRAYCGASYSFGDDVERLLADVGLSFRW